MDRCRLRRNGENPNLNYGERLQNGNRVCLPQASQQRTANSADHSTDDRANAWENRAADQRTTFRTCPTAGRPGGTARRLPGC